MRGANYFHLTGWFTLTQVQSVPIGRHVMPVIHGYVHNHKPDAPDEVKKDSFPVILAGKTANIVLEYAKHSNSKSCPRVMAHGRLIKRTPEDFPTLLVQYLEILDVDTGLLNSKHTFGDNLADEHLDAIDAALQHLGT